MQHPAAHVEPTGPVAGALLAAHLPGDVDDDGETEAADDEPSAHGEQHDPVGRVGNQTVRVERDAGVVEGRDGVEDRAVGGPPRRLAVTDRETDEEDNCEQTLHRDRDLTDTFHDRLQVFVVDRSEFRGCQHPLSQSHPVGGDDRQDRPESHDPEATDLDQGEDDQFAGKGER